MSKTTKERARWTTEDETELLNFLIEHKSEAGDGLNFKKPTWTAAATHVNEIASSRGNSRGALKSSESCKAKYRAVSVPYHVSFIKMTAFWQLKSIFDVVDQVRSNSGWLWDDEKGADIRAEKVGCWEDYVRAHPAAAPFRNKGWTHLSLFDDLGVSKNAPKGKNVFRASQSVSAATAVEDFENQGYFGDHGSPPWDESCFERASDDHTSVCVFFLS
jgi:hypothetical protein